MIVNRSEIVAHIKYASSNHYLRWLINKKKELISSNYPEPYPIRADDVRLIYTLHRSWGGGFWFYLKDGSLLDKQGVEIEQWCCSDFLD